MRGVAISAAAALLVLGCNAILGYEPGEGLAAGAGGDGGTGGADGGGGLGCNDDQDGDGYTECGGDCDDADPTSYPGADEICGDAADNDCDGETDPEALCLGLGTFVAALRGDDATGDGTQNNPVQTIAAGMANAQTIGHGVDVYVAEGAYEEKVTLAESVSLFGGYRCDADGCSWERAPDLYESTIVNVDHQGVLIGDSVTRATRLDGFRVVGRELTDGDQDLRTAAVSILGGTPALSDNYIEGGDCTGQGPTPQETVGVLVQGDANDPAGPLVEYNLLIGGDGVFTGTSSAIGFGSDAGAKILRIENNAIRGGDTQGTSIAVDVHQLSELTIRGNDIVTGSAYNAVGVWAAGAVSIEGNRVNSEVSPLPTCGGLTCYGLRATRATGAIVNNVIHGMAADRSRALYLDPQTPDGSTGLVVNGNTLHGQGQPGQNTESAAVLCGGPYQELGKAGRIRNNVLVAGFGETRYGMVEWEPSPPEVFPCEPTAFEQNVIFFPGAPTGSDVLYLQTSDGSISALTTLADVEALAFASGNLSFDPQLDETGHLLAGSACIDAGTLADAPEVDIDGDPRPQGAGVDIGADEAM